MSPDPSPCAGNKTTCILYCADLLSQNVLNLFVSVDMGEVLAPWTIVYIDQDCILLRSCLEKLVDAAVSPAPTLAMSTNVNNE